MIEGKPLQDFDYFIRIIDPIKDSDLSKAGVLVDRDPHTNEIYSMAIKRNLPLIEILKKVGRLTNSVLTFYPDGSTRWEPAG